MVNVLQAWIKQKEIYERNLKAGIGHRESIVALLEKINNKINILIKLQDGLDIGTLSQST
jgi:hypothetical protein